MNSFNDATDTCTLIKPAFRDAWGDTSETLARASIRNVPVIAKTKDNSSFIGKIIRLSHDKLTLDDGYRDIVLSRNNISHLSLR